MLDSNLLRTLLTIVGGWVMMAALAIGNPTLTEGHVSELQSGTKLHEPSLESEPDGAEKEKPNPENEQEPAVLSARELEESLGDMLMGYDHGWIVFMEVLPIQGEGGVQGDALLPANREGRSRDPQVQHGSHTPACMQEHHHLAPLHQARPLCAFR